MSRLTDHLASRVGARVRLDRGGPDLLTGTLVAVHDDYVVVLSDHGIEYHVPVHHPKSIAFIDDAPAYSEAAERPVAAEDAPATFAEFLAGCKGRRLEVYRHGPERAVGEVIECGDDYLALKTGDGEVLYYPIFHIRSVCLDPPEPGHGSDLPHLPHPETGHDSELPHLPPPPLKHEPPLPPHPPKPELPLLPHPPKPEPPLPPLKEHFKEHRPSRRKKAPRRRRPDLRGLDE